ncbi:MAG: hypothetical protein P8M25_07060 [Paracoccaceae bacterium]|nr:hypothetical protein [Paracoccaceae bacterium]
MPWERLAALIDPYHNKPRKGRPEMPLSVMLRIYLLQQWYFGMKAPIGVHAKSDLVHKGEDHNRRGP